MVASQVRHIRAVSSRLLFLWCVVLLWSFVPDVFAQPVTQPFTFSLVGHTIPQMEHAVTAVGDIDNDGDLDAFISGIIDGVIVSHVYRNDGMVDREGTPTFLFEETDAEIMPVAYGAASWGDFDGDGDLDLVVTGSRNVDPPYDPESTLYRNTGGVLATTGIQLEGFHSGDAEWGDFDNDGDIDLLLGGERGDGASETHLYRNEAGAFVNVDADLPGLAYGDAAWGDADGDGDLDLVMTGVSDGGIHADVFRNDGSTFVPRESVLEPAAFSSVSWGDFDADGDLDIIQAGGRFSPNVLEGFTRVYRNSGAAFEAMEMEVPGGISGAATWGDYDSDGDLDLLVMGAENDVFGPRLARIYANDESALVQKAHLIGVVFGSAAWGDLDGDGDLDLIASGHPTVGDPFVNIYENRRQIVEPVIEPEALESTASPGTITLRWSTSAEGPTSYNVRVGTKPGLGDIVAPMSNVATGRRLITASGNAQTNRSWTVHDLKPGTYYWSVQTIDASFRASRFAPEQQFRISQATASEGHREAVPVKTALYPAAPNPSAGFVTLQYDLAQSAAVVLRIHDLLGRTVATPLDGEQGPGRHSVVWDGRDTSGATVASGLYLCELSSDSYRDTIMLVISR